MARCEAERAERPKVVILAGDGARSGVPRHVEHLVRACSGQVRFVVVSERDRGGFAFMTRADARHISVPGLATHLRPLRLLRTARVLVRLFAREKPALIWAHARMAVLLIHLLVLVGWRGSPGCALAITYHGLPFGRGHRNWASFAARLLERIALSRGPVRSLVFLSRDAMEAFRMAVGDDACARHELISLPNSSVIGAVGTPPATDGKRHVLVCGRVSRQKNLGRALRIFAVLPGNYHLLMVGEGTDSHAFRRQARRIIGDHALRRVEFAGQVDDMRPWMSRADCFLLSSRYEGEPISALEAYEAGLPLALPDVPGCRALLASHPFATPLTGRGEAPDDVVEDALRIVTLAESHARARRQQRALIHECWAREHGYDAWAGRVSSLLAHLVGASGALSPQAQGQSAPRHRSPSVVFLDTRSPRRSEEVRERPD